MKALLLDVKNEVVKVVDIEDELSVYYKLLDCDFIDIVVRNVGGRVFDIICDDEGLYDYPVKISAIDEQGNPALVGNLLFAHHNKEGDITGLSDDDIVHLQSNLGMVFTEQFAGGYTAMMHVMYE